MKITHLLVALALISLTACSSTHAPRSHAKVKPASPPETVLITYNVKPGMEMALENTLVSAWEIYTKEHMVLPRPHTVVLVKETGNKAHIVEIFTWASHEMPDNAPNSVKQLWAQMSGLCEARDGRGAIQGGEVGLLIPQM